MNKKFSIVVAALVSLLLLVAVDSALRQFLLNVTFAIKSEFVTLRKNVHDIIQEHFDQQQKIRELQAKTKELFRYKILFEDIKDRLNSLQKECNATVHKCADLELATVISYTKFGDFTSLWIDRKIPENSVYGVLDTDNVAGIAINQDGHTKVLLLGNKKCSFGVIIGKKANGIAIGTGDNRYVDIRYIPTYQKIRIGDEVVTNGLDSIFVYGVKVGKVVHIANEGSYQVARVRVYADLAHPRFLWLMKL